MHTDTEVRLQGQKTQMALMLGQKVRNKSDRSLELLKFKKRKSKSSHTSL